MLDLFKQDGFFKISYNDAKSFLLPRHYSGRTPAISYAYGYYQNYELVAVCTIGKPASPSLCVGVCGSRYASNVYELNRLCVDGMTKIKLSKFVSLVLKELKSSGDFIIVSYADSAMNHHGYIYQATNFIYTGKTKPRTDIGTKDGAHSRHYAKKDKSNIRKLRSAKHRYIYFVGNKRFKKEAIKNLSYPIETYPKGDNERYRLGDYIKDKYVK